MMPRVMLSIGHPLSGEPGRSLYDASRHPGRTLAGGISENLYRRQCREPAGAAALQRRRARGEPGEAGVAGAGVNEAKIRSRMSSASSGESIRLASSGFGIAACSLRQRVMMPRGRSSMGPPPQADRVVFVSISAKPASASRHSMAIGLRSILPMASSVGTSTAVK
jgi:hypothetical protein